MTATSGGLASWPFKTQTGYDRPIRPLALSRVCRRGDLLEADREEVTRLVQSGAARVEARERPRQDLAMSKSTNLNE